MCVFQRFRKNLCKFLKILVLQNSSDPIQNHIGQSPHFKRRCCTENVNDMLIFLVLTKREFLQQYQQGIDRGVNNVQILVNLVKNVPLDISDA